MDLYFECPHCNGMVNVLKSEINCGIFRHGYFKSTNMQIPSHASKEQCDLYIKNDKIYGCGKPFRLILDSNKIKIEMCEYI